MWGMMWHDSARSFAFLRERGKTKPTEIDGHLPAEPYAGAHRKIPGIDVGLQVREVEENVVPDNSHRNEKLKHPWSKTITRDQPHPEPQALHHHSVVEKFPVLCGLPGTVTGALQETEA